MLVLLGLLLAAGCCCWSAAAAAAAMPAPALGLSAVSAEPDAFDGGTAAAAASAPPALTASAVVGAMEKSKSIGKAFCAHRVFTAEWRSG